ncbi:sigma factor [Aquibaculum arenosum]|uniref:Sigma factor n=1 Tax=Aquibaculum arenosum TaxID=3032591 RepID=A0ABT5YK02_9PROT|nr:sigma factor [Fodinicurvata sp. CAU 1616]MDF2095254.1 sigma factor [Fodinicurvata sp. CAU 1616]
MASFALPRPPYAGIVAQIPDLLDYALARCLDLGTAEELVEECIIRALTRVRQHRSEREMRAWVFTILHNLCLAQPVRSPKRRPPSRVEVAEAAHRVLLRALGKASMALPYPQSREGTEVSVLLAETGNAARDESWTFPMSPTLH